jgi:hypothetical protein
LAASSWPGHRGNVDARRTRYLTEHGRRRRVSIREPVRWIAIPNASAASWIRALIRIAVSSASTTTSSIKDQRTLVWTRKYPTGNGAMASGLPRPVTSTRHAVVGQIPWPDHRRQDACTEAGDDVVSPV